MHHPTIFDNLRVVLEGAVYDRDLAGEILVTDRADVMNMATFQRHYELTFQWIRLEAEPPKVKAQIQLTTHLADIASEQLQTNLTEHVGCAICLHFFLEITDVQQETEAIAQALRDLWGYGPHIIQSVSFTLDEHKPLIWPPETYHNQVTLTFDRKIDEGNIEDIHGFVAHCVQSLVALENHTQKAR